MDAVDENAKKNGNEKFDEETIRNEYRPAAIWNLKWQLVKDKIIEIENIVVTEAAKEAYLVRSAKDRGIDEKKLRSSLNTDKAQRRFEEDVLESKVLDYLENNSKIEDRKITKQDIEKSKQISMSP